MSLIFYSSIVNVPVPSLHFGLTAPQAFVSGRDWERLKTLDQSAPLDRWKDLAGPIPLNYQIHFLFSFFAPFCLRHQKASDGFSGGAQVNIRRILRRFLGRSRKSRRREAAGRGNSPEAVPDEKGEEGKMYRAKTILEWESFTRRHRADKCNERFSFRCASWLNVGPRTFGDDW